MKKRDGHLSSFYPTFAWTAQVKTGVRTRNEVMPKKWLMGRPSENRCASSQQKKWLMGRPSVRARNEVMLQKPPKCEVMLLSR